MADVVFSRPAKLVMHGEQLLSALVQHQCAFDFPVDETLLWSVVGQLCLIYYHHHHHTFLPTGTPPILHINVSGRHRETNVRNLVLSSAGVGGQIDLIFVAVVFSSAINHVDDTCR